MDYPEGNVWSDRLNWQQPAQDMSGCLISDGKLSQSRGVATSSVLLPKELCVQPITSDNVLCILCQIVVIHMTLMSFLNKKNKLTSLTPRTFIPIVEAVCLSQHLGFCPFSFNAVPYLYSTDCPWWCYRVWNCCRTFSERLGPAPHEQNDVLDLSSVSSADHHPSLRSEDQHPCLRLTKLVKPQFTWLKHWKTAPLKQHAKQFIVTPMPC